MKTYKLIQMTAAFSAVTLLTAAHLQAQTWQTVLDYTLSPGVESDGDGIAADAFGNVFSGGNGGDASGLNHGLVLKTDTAQLNWFLSDDSNPSPAQYQSVIWNLGVDSAGSVYSIGQLTPNNSTQPYWYIRKSSDGGLNWSTVDLYQYVAGIGIDATGFAADDSGSIYVAGWSRDATRQSNIHWLVRKSSDGGSSWALVDDVTGQTANGAGFVPGIGLFVVGGRFDGLSSWFVRRSANGQSGTWQTVDGPVAKGAARAVCGDSLGNVYVAGSLFVATGVVKSKGQTITNGYYAWSTRKSANGGSTWTTVDSFTYAPNVQSDAWGIARDASGNIVVVGDASDAQTKKHWIVRKLGSSGWQTIDDFQLQPGYNASAGPGIATDAAGNLLVTGIASDATGGHWIVRKAAP